MNIKNIELIEKVINFINSNKKANPVVSANMHTTKTVKQIAETESIEKEEGIKRLGELLLEECTYNDALTMKLIKLILVQNL